MYKSDFKYLLAYLIPLSGVVAISGQHWLSYVTLFYGFVAIPILEMILPQSSKNFSKEHNRKRATIVFFDILLYLHLPILYGIISFFIYEWYVSEWSIFEMIGKTFALGIVLATCGINVAHELGHKREKFKQYISKALLLPSLYMHFFIEHNRGHHLRVATWEDPATARKNETLFSFWIRSVFGGAGSAWQLERKRLDKSEDSGLRWWHNEMVLFILIQGMYVLVLFCFLDVQLFLLLLAGAIISFLTLETINYIEHYGLMRERLDNGRYERVKPMHSWNSNHTIGRIMLFELTRHSDHHYRATKEYQTLDHHEDSPQLPLGYPGSMLLSLIPPLWFKIMNPLLK